MKYLTNCITANGYDIGKMVDRSSSITRKTFLRNVYKPNLIELEESLGYAKHHMQGLTMSADWHVSYHKSTYRGKPCYYFTHSCIEYIFA